jgi:hypothetical protein
MKRVHLSTSHRPVGAYRMLNPKKSAFSDEVSLWFDCLQEQVPNGPCLSPRAIPIRRSEPVALPK